MAEPERRPALIVSHVDITYRVKASKKMSLAEDGDDEEQAGEGEEQRVAVDPARQRRAEDRAHRADDPEDEPVPPVHPAGAGVLHERDRGRDADDDEGGGRTGSGRDGDTTARSLGSWGSSWGSSSAATARRAAAASAVAVANRSDGIAAPTRTTADSEARAAVRA